MKKQLINYALKVLDNYYKPRPQVMCLSDVYVSYSSTKEQSYMTIKHAMMNYYNYSCMNKPNLVIVSYNWNMFVTGYLYYDNGNITKIRINTPHNEYNIILKGNYSEDYEWIIEDLDMSKSLIYYD